MMKAIRVHEFGGPEVMRLEEVQDPQPGPEQVLIKVHAVGINPVDTYIRAGAYVLKPSLPYTPGSDASGTGGRIMSSTIAPPVILKKLLN